MIYMQHIILRGRGQRRLDEHLWNLDPRGHSPSPGVSIIIFSIITIIITILTFEPPWAKEESKQPLCSFLERPEQCHDFDLIKYWLT